MQRSIELRDEQLQALQRLAAVERRSVGELVQRAVSDYLARRREWSEWGCRWDALVEDVQSRMPTDVTPEEIEADITAARDELRAERATARGATSLDAGGR
jgi:predicted transcriptional regulator